MGAAAIALLSVGVAVEAMADESPLAVEVPVVVEVAVSVLELHELRASRQAARAGRVERSIVLWKRSGS
jgi:hypothetical protein